MLMIEPQHGVFANSASYLHFEIGVGGLDSTATNSAGEIASKSFASHIRAIAIAPCIDQCVAVSRSVAIAIGSGRQLHTGSVRLVGSRSGKETLW